MINVHSEELSRQWREEQEEESEPSSSQRYDTPPAHQLPVMSLIMDVKRVDVCLSVRRRSAESRSSSSESRHSRGRRHRSRDRESRKRRKRER